MMLQAGPVATGGNAGPSMQPADMPMVADQTSPPRKQLRQDDGGSGPDLSAIHAGGHPIAQSHENMAEETTVERVTRRSARYQPQATVLRQEIFELQNALQNNRYYAVEETSCARAWALTANMFINRWVYCLVGARMMLSYRGARDCEGKRDGTDGRTEDASKVYGSTYIHICISAYTTWVLLSMQPYWYTQR